MPIVDLQKRREYQREWRARRRIDWFKDKVCIDCGGTDRLELDHIERTQKVSHKIWSWSQERREAELAKCVVRCRDCHRKRTTAQLQRPVIHGTRDGYMEHGCRCNKCTMAAARYRNSQRYRTGMRKPPQRESDFSRALEA